MIMFFYERHPTLTLAITSPEYLKVKGYTQKDKEINKNFGEEKIHRQKLLKKYFARNLINE